MGADFFGFAYAATVAAGGIIGYAKAHSIPSLAAGLVFGSLLGYGAYQLTRNPNSYHLSLGASLFLTVLMGYRFVNSGKVMPAGIVAGLSLVNVIRLSYRVAMPIKEGRTNHQNTTEPLQEIPDNATLTHSLDKITPSEEIK